MQKKIPLFPLNLVVFPNENLNLHIFEPRYRELVNDCQAQKITFGIPTYMDERMPGYGTEVEITSIETVYEDGRMDIKTKGINVFRLIDFQNPWEDHNYAGGLVQTIPLDNDDEQLIRSQLIEKVQELFNLLQIQFNLQTKDFDILSFGLAHKIGLSTEQKYAILTMETEKERQDFMLDHLQTAIPIIREVERTKQLVRMNGHFKNFDPLNF